MATLMTLPTVEQEWQRFQDDLAACLGAMEDDEYLVISAKHRQNCYVQFAQGGSFGMRAEAVGNSYADPEEALTTDDYDRMVFLGWMRATVTPGESSPDGSPNFFIETPAPVDYGAVAELAVRSLRDIYKIGHPRRLQYKAFNRKGTSIRFPSLRIKREA